MALSFTEYPKIYSKSVLHLLRYITNLYLLYKCSVNFGTLSILPEPAKARPRLKNTYCVRSQDLVPIPCLKSSNRLIFYRISRLRFVLHKRGFLIKGCTAMQLRKLDSFDVNQCIEEIKSAIKLRGNQG